MTELETCLRDLVAAVRAAYQPTLAHDALVRATIVELTQLDEPAVGNTNVRPAGAPLVFERVVPNAVPPPISVSATTEHAIIEILCAEQSESRISDAFDRKEAQLRTLFCSLAPLEAAALRKRLVDPGDALAAQFARLTTERRGRLIAVLADARRREALQHARGRVAIRGAR